MAQLVEQSAVDPSTDVDAGAGWIGLEFVGDASDDEAAERLALLTAEKSSAAVGGPERVRVFVTRMSWPASVAAIRPCSVAPEAGVDRT